VVTVGAPEAWLRGPLPGIEPLLQPVAHALVQVREDLPPLLESLAPGQLWASPGGSAPIGFHAAHLAGSLDRLVTYARGEALSDAQREALRAEALLAAGREDGAALARRVTGAIDAALHDLAAFRADDVLAVRDVGRAKLPSNVLGLLFHAAEHTTRHAGQVSTLVRVLGAGGSR
jgi:hypothetical protein